MSLKAIAPAKINLTLDILDRRPDGYHDVSMLMQTVTLFDELTFEKNDSQEISISSSDLNIPCDSRNIVYKAAKAFFDYVGKDMQGGHFHIEKSIPSEAGLAGGSADGAAALMMLNYAFDTHLSEKELCEIGAKVGADVPFCIVGGTKLATGTGTTLTKVRKFPKCIIVIVKPEVSVSTKEAYSLADKRTGAKFSYTNVCKDMLYRGDLSGICSTFHNDFEEVLKLDEINEIKLQMYKAKALGCAMSGSGSAVFGVFRNSKKAEKCAQALRDKWAKVYITQPCDYGAKIIE